MDFIRLPGDPASDGCFTYSMGSLNHSSMWRKSPYAGPQPFEPSPYELGLKAERRPNLLREKSHHHRCTSESNLLEKPPWFDDLLNEPDNCLLATKGHRRSMSDSSTYVSAIEFNTQNTNKEKNKLEICTPCEPQNSVWNDEDIWKVSIEKSQSSPNLQNSEDSGPSLSSVLCLSGTDGNAKHDREQDIVSQNKEGPFEKSGAPQTKPSLIKGEDKRAKQCRQSAHRSRIRKLQYIADLERNIQVLQVEGSEFSAALEFLDQQKFILDMENRALRQRLDSLSQEHMIKHMEQEMLESEIGRLRSTYQRQMQQQPKRNRKKHKDEINAQLTQTLYHS